MFLPHLCFVFSTSSSPLCWFLFPPSIIKSTLCSFFFFFFCFSTPLLCFHPPCTIVSIFHEKVMDPRPPNPLFSSHSFSNYLANTQFPPTAFTQCLRRISKSINIQQSLAWWRGARQAAEKGRREGERKRKKREEKVGQLCTSYILLYTFKNI